MSGVVLVVGGNSFIAGSFLERSADDVIRVVAHGDALDPDLYAGVDTVVNFGVQPGFMTEPYREDLDFDAALAAAIGDRVNHYVMLSSRKVYAPEQAWGADEERPCAGADTYGRNRIQSERAVIARLGAHRVTVLRLGNVIGYERIPGRRMFMAQVLNRLLDRGEILFDMSPFVRRDFVPVDAVSEGIWRAVRQPHPGTYNLASGVPLMTGRIAMWVLEGYGQGELRVTDPRIFDEFCLDVGRYSGIWGRLVDEDGLARYCVGLGSRLLRERGNA